MANQSNLLTILEKTREWKDIHYQLSKYAKILDKHTIGELFELFCKYYYITEPTVSSDYKHVWLFNEIPQGVKSKLALGNVDHGIDLLLEGYDGAFSAVQCKFTCDQNKKIYWTKNKLANLFADGSKATYCIVFTNASGVDPHTAKQEKLKLISLKNLLNLSLTTIKKIREQLLGLPLTPDKKATPRPDQEKAIQKVLQGFRNNDRGQLIIPCGVGKTLIALWIKEAINANHTIMLVPSLALIKQIKDEWVKNSNCLSFVPYIFVCSDKDIDKNDGLVIHLYDINGKVVNEPEEILRFLTQHEKSVVYCTYQSLNTISEAIKESSFSFDLAICDEAHKTSSEKQGIFALIHHNEKIRIKKRLYMTATPRVLSKNNQELEKYSYDMSDHDIFGPEFFCMSFKEGYHMEIGLVQELLRHKKRRILFQPIKMC